MNQKTPLPHGWEWTTLGDVVTDMKDGGTPPRNNPENFGGDIHWAVVKDIRPEIKTTRETLTERGLNNCSAKVWPVNSVIISLGATIGNVGIAKIPLATKQGLSGIVVNNKKISYQYLYYFLLHSKQFILSLASGTTIKEIRPPKLQSALTIPLPRLAEQKRIVQMLERQLVTVEKARIAAEKRLSEANALSAATLRAVFSSAESQKWQRKKIEEVCELIFGQSPPSTYYNKNAQGLPFFQGKADFGAINPVPRIWCTHPLRQASPGDILISIRAPVGPTNVANIDCSIGRGLAALRANKKIINSDFLLFYLNYTQQQLAEMGSGSTFQAIGKQVLSGHKVPLPPLAQQKRIADLLGRQLAVAEKLRAVSAAELDDFGALPAALLRMALSIPPIPHHRVIEA